MRRSFRKRSDNDNVEKMRELARRLDLYYGGDEGLDERKIFGEYVFYDVTNMSKREFRDLLSDFSEVEVKTESYSVGIAYDVSSYGYWNEVEGEDFYAYVNIMIKNLDTLDFEQLEDDVAKAISVL